MVNFLLKYNFKLKNINEVLYFRIRKNIWRDVRDVEKRVLEQYPDQYAKQLSLQKPLSASVDFCVTSIRTDLK
jgi:hypothetical protein